MGKTALLFPGQGSQQVGMGKDFFDQVPISKEIFQKANERLDFDLTSIIFNGPQEELTLTYNAQPALLTTSAAIFEALKQYEVVFDYVAGHSLGEYTALVAANVMTVEDAVYVVRKRGELMEKAVPAGEGSMAAVLGMVQEELENITKQISNEGTLVQLANLNCPGQIVISGTKEGVQRAGELAKEKGAKRVIPLEVSGPFHSELMKPAANELSKVLDEVTIQDASVPVIANVTAVPVQNKDEIKSLLIEQLYSPVRWEESVRSMIQAGVTTFIEIGAGKVLTGLVKKVDRSVKTYNIFDLSSLEAVVHDIKEV